MKSRALIIVSVVSTMWLALVVVGGLDSSEASVNDAYDAGYSVSDIGAIENSDLKSAVNSTISVRGTVNNGLYVAIKGYYDDSVSDGTIQLYFGAEKYLITYSVFKVNESTLSLMSQKLTVDSHGYAVMAVDGSDYVVLSDSAANSSNRGSTDYEDAYISIETLITVIITIGTLRLVRRRN